MYRHDDLLWQHLVETRCLWPSGLWYPVEIRPISGVTCLLNSTGSHVHHFKHQQKHTYMFSHRVFDHKSKVIRISAQTLEAKVVNKQRKKKTPHPCAESGVDSRGALQADTAEGLCIHTRGGLWMGWNWTEIRDHVTRWCQRKSVWCASSCHKCIDIRHRHSSPLSTERLATVCLFVCLSFFFFKKCPSARNR